MMDGFGCHARKAMTAIRTTFLKTNGIITWKNAIRVLETSYRMMWLPEMPKWFVMTDWAWVIPAWLYISISGMLLSVMAAIRFRPNMETCLICMKISQVKIHTNGR